jgi:hypothetical protein
MNEKFSFKRGWRQVRRKDSKAVQERIMMVLGVHTAMSWSRYLNGRIEPRITEYKAINAIFGEYGITDVWGK